MQWCKQSTMQKLAVSEPVASLDKHKIWVGAMPITTVYVKIFANRVNRILGAFTFMKAHSEVASYSCTIYRQKFLQCYIFIYKEQLAKNSTTNFFENTM